MYYSYLKKQIRPLTPQSRIARCEGAGQKAPFVSVSGRGLMKQFVEGFALYQAPLVEEFADAKEIHRGDRFAGPVGAKQEHGVRRGMLEHHVRAGDARLD